MGDQGIRVVRRQARLDRAADAALATRGVQRFEAYAAEDRWIGYATTVPGEWGGWHHHGEHDTYLFLVSGTIELEFGPAGRERVAVEAGDFVHVPAGAIHREGTPPGAPGEAVVVRLGRGPTVVNVDAPEEDR